MNKDCGSNSGVECQPSKLFVAGSNPVTRSNFQPSGCINNKKLPEGWTMPQNHYNIELNQGDTFSLNLTVKEANGSLKKIGRAHV